MKYAQNVTLEYFGLGVCVLLVAYIVFFISRVFKYEKLSKDTVPRVFSEPENLVNVELAEYGSLQLTVQFRGEEPIVLTSLRSLASVRLFDHIKASAPQAYCRTTRGGEDVFDGVVVK